MNQVNFKKEYFIPENIHSTPPPSPPRIYPLTMEAPLNNFRLNYDK